MLPTIQELNSVGWCEIQSTLTSDEDLIETAKHFGLIILHPNGKCIDQLSPKGKTQAIKDTFSYNYEFGEFPFHTDTAFWNTPVRYILMSCTKSSTSTTIIKWQDMLSLCSDAERKILEKAIFLIKTPRYSFYTQLFNRYSSETFFRFDPNCMFPKNNSAKVAEEILKDKIKETHVTKISWDRPKVLIIDNWKALHGRDAIYNKDRILRRIYINKI